METCKIKTLENNERMSTQQLLQAIYQKIDEGYTDFEIDACGQHNIGGSLWAKNRSEKLSFKVFNPGQRVGGMAMAGTRIVVEGSAPADVGWLNSGAEIVVKGDCGDTAAHCAAGGKIYAGGRVGTRSGALMKHDPKFNPPQFWVLKNTGSFSFEFMGGGIAVVCGYGCDYMPSVMGERSCVGMVGGTIYFRGKLTDIADCVSVLPLEDEDIEFINSGFDKFLAAIEKTELKQELTDYSQWKKIVPKTTKEKSEALSVKEFRHTKWIEGGIFGDFIEDDFTVYPLNVTGEGRLQCPKWDKETCVDCKICLNNCPQSAISECEKTYSVNDDKCIGCGICAAVCPRKCWTMQSNIKEIS